MRISDFDFEYPEELVAAYAVEPRDAARLLVVRRGSGAREHRVFAELPGLLSPGDCLVLNRTRVLAARLLGRKATGGRADLLLVRELEPGRWAVLASGLKAGGRLEFAGGLEGTVESLDDDGQYVCRFSRPDIVEFLEAHGMAPLPPYILKRRRGLGRQAQGPGAPAPSGALEDRSRYQTVYASQAGSIAAPTAGLHFTPEVLARLEGAGVIAARLTLHVGRGTFRPIEAADPADHRMLPEWYRMEAEDARAVASALAAGRRVVAVGTTSTRVLETLAASPRGLTAAEGWTDLYIRPGHAFKAVGGLVTNFHLPRSTPLMLAAAFLGRERLLAAYEEAVARRYRLFSLGDAMLIL
ncbi:MAG: tRNA preQ1(34) S-adenosylmethionine ribosyltransferase-isomerase QueA [Elusimicrobia bacterium]|nr:tRNA preQ1(34) S-adenosylmethionine ribosyltransferase-isomerase QueA [Elusimicrobiota bacterium]